VDNRGSDGTGFSESKSLNKVYGYENSRILKVIREVKMFIKNKVKARSKARNLV